MKQRLYLLIFLCASLVFIGCDRITKDIAKKELKDGPTVTYFNNALRLEYAENTGAALNLGDNLDKKSSFWLLSMIPLAFLIGLAVYTIRNAAAFTGVKILSLILIFSGGIGNIIDRVLYDRHVTDFMIVTLGSWHTGIFNVADICVSAGVIGLLLFPGKKKMQDPPSDQPLANEV